MKLYRHAGNIKSGLFIMGITLVIGLLAYTQILVNQLRRDNRSIVRLYAGLIANVVEDENDTNLDYIFENIIQKVKFPLIQTDTDHNPQMWKNLPKNVVSDKEINNFISTEIEWIPLNSVEISKEKNDDMINFFNTLEDDDDVQNIYSNVQFGK